MPSAPSQALRLSVIVPAHNEEAVIERCLTSLLDGLDIDRSEIIVCCNGCSDGTAAIAGSFGSPVRVVVVDEASKPAALNAGATSGSGAIKAYVDADVIVSGADVEAVADALENGPAHVAAPGLRVDTSASSKSVDLYYKVWITLPYVTHHLVGSGFYALDREGQARVGEFPEIIGDDAYVRCLFRPAARVSVPGTHFTVVAPRDLRSLVNIETRRKAALGEMRTVLAECVGDEGPSQRRAILAVGASPRKLPQLLVYLYVKTSTRLGYQWRKRRGTDKTWSRDESSRQHHD